MEFKPNPLLYGAHEDFLSSFKLVVTMRDDVSFELFENAVRKAMKRYPYFNVRPKISGDDIILEYNDCPVPVIRGEHCPTLASDEVGGHLLAFAAEGKRIILHASHYIADGMGISPLLMTVLYLYVSQKYGSEGLNTKRIVMPDSPISDEEYAYPFPEKAEFEPSKREEKEVYSLNPDAFDGDGLYAYHLRIPQRSMMSVANPSDGSPVSFLSVMLYRALCAIDEGLDKSVVAHVQHQYRAAINTPYNRHSLVSYIPTELSTRIKNRRVELQNTVIRGQIIIESEPENDLRAVSNLVGAFPAGKSLAEKQRAMREFVDESIKGKTFGISYVGKMDWCGMDKYVEDLHAYIGEKDTKNMLLIEVMTIGEDFTINFMQSGRGTLYVDAFVRELKNFDIPVSIVGEERYFLSKTKILH